MAMGYVAGKDAAENVKSSEMPKLDAMKVDRLIKKLQSPLEKKEGVRPQEIKTKVRETLQRSALFQRNAGDLKEGIKVIEDMKENMLPKLYIRAKTKTFNLEWMEALEAENMVNVAEMVLRSALMREESRGLHEREDFPKTDQKWLKHIIIKKVDNEMSFSTEPVTFPYVQPK